MRTPGNTNVGGRYIGWTFDLENRLRSMALPDPQRLQNLAGVAQKALKRKCERLKRQYGLECWQSIGESASWVPISKRVAAKMGVDKQSRLVNPALKLDRERVVRTVLIDPDAQLTSSSLQSLAIQHQHALPASLPLGYQAVLLSKPSGTIELRTRPRFETRDPRNPFKRRRQPPPPPTLGF
jgi:hypothetical protein